MREQHTVNVNGLTLSYVVDGPETAPAVVLVHGHGADADDWSAIVDDLARDHRVHALTQRGHHGSDWAPEYSFAHSAADIAGFVSALGLDEVVLVGHSLGGIAAVFTARRRPSWLSKLVLEETPVPTPGWFSRVPPTRPEAATNDWDHIAPKLEHELMNPDPGWWPGLAAIDVPTLVIAGGEESGFPQHNITGVDAVIPNCHVETIPVGHLVHAAAPQRFLAVLRDFLAS
ncbi:MAG: alpha/beta fold hydrolase [Stackebrandtia sp.]